MDVRSKRCGHQGCNMLAKYGVLDTTRAEFCSQHAREGMVDVRNKGCGHHGCSTQPSYRFPGETSQVCAQHAREGMVSKYGKHRGVDGPDVDAPARRPAKKRRAQNAGADPPVSVAVPAEEERDSVTGALSSSSAGPSCRLRSTGFTPRVPVAVKAEDTRQRTATPVEDSPLESQSESAVAAETRVTVST